MSRTLTRDDYWTTGAEAPEIGRMQRALVAAGICSWDDRHGPHPLEFALVAWWAINQPKPDDQIELRLRFRGAEAAGRFQTADETFAWLKDRGVAVDEDMERYIRLAETEDAAIDSYGVVDGSRCGIFLRSGYRVDEPLPASRGGVDPGQEFMDSILPAW